jgi:hypothetical protein
MTRTQLNRDEIEAMILAKVRAQESGKNISQVMIGDDIDENGNPTFTVDRLRASGGPVLPDAQRIAIEEAHRLRAEFRLRS